MHMSHSDFVPSSAFTIEPTLSVEFLHNLGKRLSLSIPKLTDHASNSHFTSIRFQTPIANSVSIRRIMESVVRLRTTAQGRLMNSRPTQLRQHELLRNAKLIRDLLRREFAFQVSERDFVRAFKAGFEMNLNRIVEDSAVRPG